MSNRTEILWTSVALTSAEHCVIRDDPGENCVVGAAVLDLQGQPAHLEYAVMVDDDWATCSAWIQLQVSGQQRELRIERTHDGWYLDGRQRPDLVSCTNVDLGWTPATNTLALRHQPLKNREARLSSAAWVRFPEFDVVPAEQTYRRISDEVVRYESPTFEADLQVSPHDVVTKYGDGLWVAQTAIRAG